MYFSFQPSLARQASDFPFGGLAEFVMCGFTRGFTVLFLVSCTTRPCCDNHSWNKRIIMIILMTGWVGEANMGNGRECAPPPACSSDKGYCRSFLLFGFTVPQLTLSWYQFVLILWSRNQYIIMGYLTFSLSFSCFLYVCISSSCASQKLSLSSLAWCYHHHLHHYHYHYYYCCNY